MFCYKCPDHFYTLKPVTENNKDTGCVEIASVYEIFRAVNNALLDTYQLKSQDGIIETDVKDIALMKTTD